MKITLLDTVHSQSHKTWAATRVDHKKSLEQTMKV